jgi:hypothetical protein
VVTLKILADSAPIKNKETLHQHTLMFVKPFENAQRTFERV